MWDGTKFARRLALPLFAGSVAVAMAAESLGPVPAPPENPPTEAKRVLGKMLFFEEQLSSDDSVACATCHLMTSAGTDPRRGRNPGSNSVFGDLGDVMGSPGVEPMAEDGTFRPAPHFGASVQVTPRTAPSPFAAMYQKEILWDGRAGSTFTDTVTGQVVIASGGALESQALLPLTNEVEMGHAGRDLAQVTAKLAASRPLALASDLPPDVALALSNDPGYPELFRRAFGDPAITPVRIAMAIATYERTLAAAETQYDRYAAGAESALTPQQIRGLQALTTSKCTTCHVPPLFTDGTFRATGVRSPSEDKGRAVATSNNADRGKFKVPTLRNVALKESFFHDGQRTELGQAIDFYAVEDGPIVDGVRQYGSPSGGHSAVVPSDQFVDNQDPVMPTIRVSPENALDIAEFLTNALVDPRVASGAFPFDSPTLGSQRSGSRPIVHEALSATGAAAPAIAIHTPAFAGNAEFTVSVTGGPVGATARLVSWETPSADGAVRVSDPVVLASVNGVTFANASFPLSSAKPGTRLQFAWRVEDIESPGGATVTPTASVVVFEQRAKYVSGVPLVTPAALTVDDGDAYVESARFSADYRRDFRDPARDRFALLAWLGTPSAGADLASGSVSVTVGGAEVLPPTALGGDGRITGPGVTGSYDRVTGRLQLSLRDLDLRDAIVTPYSVPVRFEIAGLGLASPVATTTITFDAKIASSGPTSGRFAQRASGTGNGVFHVTAATAKQDAEGRARVRISAVLDAPETMAAWVPGSVTLSLGAGPGYRIAENELGISRGGTTYSAPPAGGLRKLRVDVVRRAFAFDATVDLPEISAAGPGSRVRVPVTLVLSPAGTSSTVTFTTTATVAVTGRR